ncbi:ATP-binding protein [Streptomyces sp. DT24]|uniref:ATP-binding protein n=1 Tax=unclassified Streptomyces TaxID=2593676 RepID=UPI003CF6D259
MATMRPVPLPSPSYTSAAGPSPRLTLPASAESVGAARQHACAFVEFYVCDLTDERKSDVLLVVSELVTNAVRYGTEPGDSIELCLEFGPRQIRIEVHDPVRRRPRARPASAERTRGRGMLIVDALATWGTSDRPMGKVVWAVVEW